ncbi:MAG: dienelactone hydrolase family protein [Nitrospirota bacterium]
MRRLVIFMGCAVLLILIGRGVAMAEVHTQAVEYRQGDTVLEGFLAYDDSFTGKRPGMLVVHDWTGVGPYVKGRCEQLARLGYVAFAADIYGKGIRPKAKEDAAKEAGIYLNDRALMRARVKAGLEELKKQDLVDPGRIAAIGYCFGGAAVLELARSGANIAGVVVFHGTLSNPNPADARNIKAKVLVLHGADDPFADRKQVNAFIDEMRKTDVDWQLVLYGGAVHGFTLPDAGNDPKKGVAYDERADRRSWQAMKDFLGEIFK